MSELYAFQNPKEIVKGLAVATTIKLVIAVIVIAIAVYFITYLANFDWLFLSNDQRTLKQYSTCALAYCSAGGSDDSGRFSDEVLGVGCLKSKGGVCETKCTDIESQVFDPDKYSFKDSYDRKHFCGKANAIPFEFDGISLGGTVPLRSGEMDKIATAPSWVCRSFRLPFTEFDLDSLTASFPGLNTADWQYHGGIVDVLGTTIQPISQRCIMLSKANTDFEAYGKAILFIGSFFVSPGKVATVALTHVSSSGVATAATGVVAKQSVKYALSTPAKGAVKQWTIQGIEKGVATTTAANFVAAEDPFNFLNLKTKGGCFTGYVYDNLNDEQKAREDILYTPIIQYQTGREDVKVYPSAIYVDEGFVGSDMFGKPECELINPSRAAARRGMTDPQIRDKIESLKSEYKSDPAKRAEYAGSKKITEKIEDGKTVEVEEPLSAKEIDQLLESDAVAYAAQQFGGDDPIIGLDMYGPISQPFEFGNMASKCQFQTAHRGSKITYYVWASPTFPGIGTMNALSRGGYDVKDVEVEGVKVSKDGIQVSDSTGELGTRFGFLNYTENTAKDFKVSSIETFSSFGSCAYVTLARDLDGSLFSETPETEPEKTEPPEDISQQPEKPSEEIVTKFEVKSDKTEYKSGEIIVISGVLQLENEAAQGKKITVEISQFFGPNPLFHSPLTVTTGEDGSFRVETKFEPQTKFRFETVAKYGKIASEPYTFIVG